MNIKRINIGNVVWSDELDLNTDNYNGGNKKCMGFRSSNCPHTPN
jgi:hypothetical protein